MKIVGIDYGHGETSAGYVDSETVIGSEIHMQDLKISGEQIVIPSILCITHNGEYIINPSANQLAQAKDVGICFKAPLVGNAKYKEISRLNKEYFKAFLAKVYESIIHNDNNPLHIDNNGNADFKVYIACPSGWNDKQIQAYRDFVRSECKIPLVDIVKESRAAYIAARRKVGGGIRNQGGNVLVIDFGSSTIDFTYFNNNTEFEPIHEGYPLGASQVERDVLEYIIKNNSTARENVNLVIERCGETKAMNSLLYEIRKQKEAYFSQDNPDYFNPSIHLRELLLDRALTGLYIEPDEVDGYSKRQLEGDILRSYIESLSKMLDDFAKRDSVSTIDKVILTGGASRMYFFKDLVCRKYGVSRNDQSLIIDLEPNLTISEGIAAFGYMNEQATPRESSLKKAVDEWIENQLPQLFKSTIEKSIGDMYYSEFSQITKRYGNGNIVKNGQHNLDGLEDAIIELLNSWSASGDDMEGRINQAIRDNIMSSMGNQLREFAEIWGYNVDGSNFDVEIDLNIQASLTPEACKFLLQYTWDNLKEFINNRDFWGWDDNTSPYKDRDSDDRKSIEKSLNQNFRLYFDNLDYMSPIDEEVRDISSIVRDKVQDFVDNAKLQQYR